MAVHNGKAFVLSYTADDNGYDKHIETVQQMVESMILS